MISSSLFVLLLATYAYSIPVGDNSMGTNRIPELTTSKSAILHLLDDGESTNVANLVEPTSATIRDGLRFTTQGSILNNERVTRGMLESSTLDSTSETSSQTGLFPRGIEDSFTTSEPMESTTSSKTMELTTSSVFRPRAIEKIAPAYPALSESAAQFNEHVIRGAKVELNMDLQTTEEPLSSSVTSFATTTGLLRGARGEQSEDLESSSMQMDDSTTDFSSTGRSNTVIEVFAGPNTKTEIIPGSNGKTEVIPGENTKTEIISESGDKTEIIRSGSNKLVGGKHPLSEGKN